MPSTNEPERDAIRTSVNRLRGAHELPLERRIRRPRISHKYSLPILVPVFVVIWLLLVL
jgi:hypothetical protein